MKRMKQGEKSKRERSPLVKRKKKPGPKKKNDSIEEAKKIRLSLLVSTLLDVFFFFVAVELRVPDFAFPIINQVSLQSGIIIQLSLLVSTLLDVIFFFAVELRVPDFAFPIINQVSLQSAIITRG